MSIKANPTYNKIVVKPMKDVEVRRGLIIIPDTVERRQTLVGIVEATGPGRITDNGTVIPCCVSVGDKILYSRHQGFPITVEEVEYTVMPDVEALMIFHPDAPKEENKPVEMAPEASAPGSASTMPPANDEEVK